MTKISNFRIIRRAFGQFTDVDTVETTWTAAMNIAMMMETYNGDGEYDIRFPDEADRRPTSPGICPVQAAFAYL